MLCFVLAQCSCQFVHGIGAVLGGLCFLLALSLLCPYNPQTFYPAIIHYFDGDVLVFIRGSVWGVDDEGVNHFKCLKGTVEEELMILNFFLLY